MAANSTILRLGRAFLMGWGIVSLSLSARAAEIQVLSGGAMEPALVATAAAFGKESGHGLKLAYATAPELVKRIAGGEAADIVIAPPAAIAELTKGGKLLGEGEIGLGRVGAGVVARDGAPLPDISTAEALKRSLLTADSIVYNRASSGLYIETMLKRMGVYDAIEAKTTRYPDGNAVMQHLMQGKGTEFGFGVVTEILLFRDKGLKLVGPLPEEIQNYTSYAASLTAASANPEPAKAFIRYLGSPAGKALLTANGIRE